jgi:Extensin-like protein C-terminus
VLGPGSDGNHEEHIHLDLAERRNNYKLCEWDVRVPPPAVAQKEDAAPPAEAAATESDDDSALIPLDIVPLPRPRPKLAEDASARAKKSDRN